MWLHAFGNGALVPTVCVQEIITTYINLYDVEKKKKLREFTDFLARVTGVETGG